MKKRYTTEEHRIWREAQPKKIVIVKAIMKSPEGNVLLLKPDYTDMWLFPGGGVNDNESPEAGLVREIHEELGLQTSPYDFTIVTSLYDSSEEMLFLVYDYTKVMPEDTPFTLQADEIEDYRYYPPNEVATQLAPYYTDFWNDYLRL